ncbi:beta-N-acetylhexosaminidase [Shouchella shacheensis]|uniref:beta-N-acetylhexosaminidase n=1 Tax=Shouchella shacheensis TaxID=1649580 RepID=UPI000740394B|nr:beta-N-acetylhexosaminidase [Shouchella shacheensis]
MRKRTGWLVLLGLTLVFTSLFTPAQTAANKKNDNANYHKRWVEKTMNDMTLDEKIGQMFMVGFQNESGPAYEVNEQAETMINEYHVGGIILFTRNVDTPSQVAGLTNALQELAWEKENQIPLMVTADQEGGRVIRIEKDTTIFPGSMALGATRSEDLAYEAGQVTGTELQAMGINANLAPSLDVNNNPDNPVIGVRSFGEDPDLVADLGTANIQGFQEAGVLATAKHFPGHGDTDVDSHIGLPSIPYDMERLREVELVPFKRAIDQGVDMIMSAHITFPEIDDTPGLPGTLSEPVLTGILREELGFDGVIITDDMEMAAIVDNFGAEEAAVKSIQAGTDIVLVSHRLDRQKASIEAVKEAVASGDISKERIDASVERILKAKAKKTTGKPMIRTPFVNETHVPKNVGTEDHQQAAAEIARQAITLVQDNDDRLPVDATQTEDAFVVSAENADAFGKAIEAHGVKTTVQSTGTQPSESEVTEIVQAAAGHDLVVVGTSSQEHGKLVEALETSGSNVIIVGLDTPYDLRGFPDASTYLAAYGYQPASLEAAAASIFGDIDPEGQLPVTIPGLYEYGHPK